MIKKLTILHLERHKRDYAILSLGTTVAVAIFYMFQTLALNQTFLVENSMINSIKTVFAVGSALLSIISIMYMTLINEFFFQNRKREFGLYITFGAKRSKLLKIMYTETFLVLLISLAVGIPMGMFLTYFTVYMFNHRLNLDTIYPWFSLAATALTIVFYGGDSVYYRLCK